MKNPLAVASLIPVLAFALAIAAQLAGLVPFHFATVAWFIGGCAACSILAFAFRDYTRRPAFRVRRATASPRQPEMKDHRAAAATQWTCHTYSA